MLTLLAYQFGLGGLLPQLSYITRMDVFLLASRVLLFSALVEVALTSHLATEERIEKARRVHRWSRLVFPTAFACVVALALLV